MLSRTHWLLFELSNAFKLRFNLYFNYELHNYVFYRNYGYRSPRIKEFFSIVRTSKRCFRLFYFNDRHGVSLTKNFKTSKDCAVFMENIHNNYFDDEPCFKNDLWIEVKRSI